METPFKVKSCGITQSSDAILACQSGADAIGLNFYKRSLRHVKKDEAREIANTVRNSDYASTKIIGVFVNEDFESIKETVALADLDYVQLHGDESAETTGRELAGFNWIRAIRCHSLSNQQIENQVDEWVSAGAHLVLLDSGSAKEYGGSGVQLPWKKLSELNLNCPWALAGGLTPENVQQAIELSRPNAVDTASGVEGFPGKKAADLVEQFIKRSLESFKAVDQMER